MFMQSTTMDYAGETTQDMLGLGIWDYAAAKVLYGNAVAVLTDPDIRAGSTTVATPSSPKGRAILEQEDNWGFQTGIQWDEFHSNTSHYPTSIHYSQLQNEFGLIHDCKAVTPETFKPATWDADKYGEWNALLDGHFVSPKNDGKYTTCRPMPVDYVTWDMLSMPVGVPRDDGMLDVVAPSGAQPDIYVGGPAIDPQGRLRVPYGFATDTWADLGNTSVYRHDNGADIYELFDFLISQEETQHIFVDYRRGRQTFSVRVASDRALTRYNQKMRDSAKGMAYMANIYRDFAQELGYPFDLVWGWVSPNYSTNLLASTIAFDYFTRAMDRPSSGPHYYNEQLVDSVMRSKLDVLLDPTWYTGTVPDGAYGTGGSNATAWGNVGYGGRLVENMLGQDWKFGEYATDFTLNCGSYYDKAFTPMLMTESADNFISYRRRDFVDPRYRAVSMADLFPDGYRRWLANNLTGEDNIKGARVAAFKSRPLVEMPECTTTPCQICGGTEPSCGTGSKCCMNTRFANPDFSVYGVCVKGDVCPQSCGFQDNSDPANDDKPCAADVLPSGQATPRLCCQGLCTTGQCFIDTSKGLGWTTWVPADGPQSCFWSTVSMEYPNAKGEAVCSGDPKVIKSSIALDPQVGWEQQKFLIAMTMQYLPENQFENWLDMMTVWELGKDADPGFDNRIEFHDPNGNIFIAKTFGREDIFGENVEKGVAARVMEYANELLYAAYDCDQVPAAAGPNDTKWYIPKLDSKGQPIVKDCPDGAPGSCTCSDSPSCVTLMRYTSVPAFFRQVMNAYAQGDPGMRGIY